MRFTEYLIVGQGLAGTLLAYHLQQKGKQVLIIDNATEGGASKIAAGVINPVTGRRIVKSWLIDDLLPAAKKTYQAIENQYNIHLWKEVSVIRTLQNADEENEWQLRSQWSDYNDYCAPQADISDINDALHHFYGYGEIRRAAQVDVPTLLQSFQNRWITEGVLLTDKITYPDIQPQADCVFYKDIKASVIIFCEGASATQNPYFNTLPFNIDKGELLIIKIPDTHFTKIIKNNISIVPLPANHYGAHTFWAGATNEWHSPHDQPTPEKLMTLKTELDKILRVPYEVIAHQAAFRPTTKDRRPFIGFHPHQPRLAIFNGFGTKGASLIPYWSARFAQFLCQNAPTTEGVHFDAAVDVRRYFL
jgi:glycine oxidase